MVPRPGLPVRRVAPLAKGHLGRGRPAERSAAHSEFDARHLEERTSAAPRRRRRGNSAALAPIEMLGGRDDHHLRARVHRRDERADEVVVVTGGQGAQRGSTASMPALSAAAVNRTLQRSSPRRVGTVAATRRRSTTPSYAASRQRDPAPINRCSATSIIPAQPAETLAGRVPELTPTEARSST